MNRRLVLASASPRRRAILSLLGVPFDIRALNVPEQPRAGESSATTAERLAQEKAEVAARLVPDAVVIAADTVVALDGQPLGKPADAGEARAMLRQLRGRAHDVSTGVVVCDATSGLCASEVVTTRVHMRDYADKEIDAYVASGDPLDKAGAYAIQHAGFHPVARIEGCYLNVVGLPLCATVHLLRIVGFPLPSNTEDEQGRFARDECICAARLAGYDPQLKLLGLLPGQHTV